MARGQDTGSHPGRKVGRGAHDGRMSLAKGLDAATERAAGVGTSGALGIAGGVGLLHSLATTTYDSPAAVRGVGGALLAGGVALAGAGIKKAKAGYDEEKAHNTAMNKFTQNQAISRINNV